MAQKSNKKQDNKHLIEKTKSVFNNGIAWLKEKPVRWILMSILVLVFGFILFRSIRQNATSDSEFQTAEISRGDLIAIVGATGIVEPKQSAELSWETSGRVELVNVGMGNQVEAGDVLAELVDNTLPQSVIIAQSDLVSAQKNLDNLLISDTESASAYRNLLEAERNLEDAEEDRDKWNYNNANLERLYEARDIFIQAEEIQRQTQDAYNATDELDDDDPERISTKETLDEARFERDKALRNLNYIMGKSYSQQVSEDFADYDLALAEYEDAVRDWERVKDGPSSDDIKAAESQVAAAEATVSLGWLEAPFDGTVTKAIPEAGDLVEVGTPGFRIDNLEELFVDVDISEVDINRVRPGQRAELTFDAITGTIFNGEVVEVATVGIDTGSGVEFGVKVKLLDADDSVRTGMTAAVNIIVNEIEDVLLVPNRAIRLIEGKRVVYILEDGLLVDKEIKIGSSSDVASEIISGELEPGMIVVLNPPLLRESNGGPPAFVR